MAHMYFDESIRDRGGFIVGALLVSDSDLSASLRACWSSHGKDPDIFEYKSSDRKDKDPQSQLARDIVSDELLKCDIGLIVCPIGERKLLGDHCRSLLCQLRQGGLLSSGSHNLYFDQGIKQPRTNNAWDHLEVTVQTECDSKFVAGIQLADHAAHVMGTLLLEEMGLLSKLLVVGEEHGYEPDSEVPLGFELLAKIRYQLIGNDEEIQRSLDSNQPFDPYRQVDGYGLFVSQTCDSTLASAARRRFGKIYLGCIH